MARGWPRIGLVIAAIAAAPCGGGCADAPPPTSPKRAESVPRWSDVFDTVPDVYAVVRPQALRQDRLYGSLWRSLIRAAQARGFVRGASMMEVVEGADEIIVGLNRGLDAALVLRGVPASVDPQKVGDAQGRPLFRAIDDRAKVVEYELVHPKEADVGALFVLPDRTWVGTLGDARARARQVFATPVNRPSPQVDTAALITVRFAGAVGRALERHPTFGLVSRKLSSATFGLEPGKGGLRIGLSYEEADAAALAEMQVRRIVEELSKDEARYGWLKGTKVAYEGVTVSLRLAVPPRLLEELPSASGAEIGL